MMKNAIWNDRSIIQRCIRSSKLNTKTPFLLSLLLLLLILLFVSIVAVHSTKPLDYTERSTGWFICYSCHHSGVGKVFRTRKSRVQVRHKHLLSSRPIIYTFIYPIIVGGFYSCQIQGWQGITVYSNRTVLLRVEKRMQNIQEKYFQKTAPTRNGGFRFQYRFFSSVLAAQMDAVKSFVCKMGLVLIY